MNKILLIILDGWGLAQPWGGNSIAVAKTPFFNYIWRTYPHTQLRASGTDVGLPGHEMGNSEVGHLNIGAGKIVRQDILNVNEAIENGTFFSNRILIQAMDRVRGTSNNLHIMGLLSDGGVHAHTSHAIALLNLAHARKIKNIYIHIFTDGRDTPPMSAQTYIARLSSEIKKLDTGTIATVSGRYWAMDRDHNWERIDKVYKAMTEGVGKRAPSAMSAVGAAYGRGETDEFILPTIIENRNLPPQVMDGDSIIFWNFRSDRARELTQAFLRPQIEKYNRSKVLKNLFFVSLIPYGYEKDIGVRPYVAFEPEKIYMTLASVLADHKIPQLHIAETEKYAHITFFLNGMIEKPFPLEERVIVPSPAVATYDLKPEMSAPIVTNEVIKGIKSNKFGLIAVNFANLDMVGHSGNFAAIVKACEIVDTSLSEIVKQANDNGYYSVITADHGNAEEAINPITNEISTEHTKNPVPFILVPIKNDTNKYILRTDGRLSDVTPTLLYLMQIEKPSEMSGNNLIIINYNKNGKNNTSQ